MMQIYNTQTRRKEEFKPIEPGKVRIYCCGPTVYNYFHIGNARPFIVFDTLRRYLEHKGYEVKYVQNFTDIDDKMIRRANEEGITVKELGDRFIKEYYTDADALGIERATVNPRATEHIADIIALIEKLIDKGLAYACDNGDVYYNTQAFPGYGKLCGQNSRIWRAARASTLTRTSAIRWISPSGRRRSRANRHGNPRGAWVVRAGISSAPR